MEQFRPWRYRPVFPCAVYPVDRIARYTRGVTSFNMEAWTPALPLEGYAPLLWLRADQGVSTGGARQFYSVDKTSATLASFAAVNLSTTDFSLVANVYRTTTGNQVLAAKYQDATNYWRFEITAGHKLHFIAVVSGSTLIEVTGTTNVSTTATWYHCAVVVDRDAAGTTEVYLNGVNDTAGTPTVSASTIDNTGAFFLAQAGDGTLYLNARLSRVGVFKADLLTQTEITWLYNLGRSRIHGSLGEVGTDGASLAPTWWSNCNESSDTASIVDQAAANTLALSFGELITNGGFETAGGGGADVFGSWTEEKAGTATITDEAVNVDAGSHAAKLEAGDSYAQLYQDILTVGHRYAYTTRIKAVSATGTTRLYLGSGTAITPTITASYATYSGTGTCATNGLFVIQAHSGGPKVDAYWDTVSVTAVDIPSVDGPSSDIAPDTGSVGTAHGQLIGFADSETARSTDVPSAIGSGTSLVLDGVDDYVQLTSITLPSGDASWCARVKTSTAETNRYVFDLGGNKAGIAIANGKVTAFSTGGPGAGFISVAGNDLRDGMWHHIAVTQTGTTLEAYVDGVSIATKLGVDVGAITAAGRIGDYQADGSNTYVFPGYIDDVQIFDSALSLSQVGQLYANTAVTGATPIHKWTFDEQTSLSVTDGDPIATWTSLEGSRHQFIQATASKRPVYRASAINGQAGIDFDGVDDLLAKASAFLTGTSGTVVVVYRLDAVPNTYQVAFGNSDEAGDLKYLLFYSRGNTANPHINIWQSNADTADGLDGDSTVNVDTDYAATFGSNGTVTNARLNGISQTLNADNGSNNGDWWDDTSAEDNTAIGGWKRSSGETYNMSGKIAEIQVWPHNFGAESISKEAAYILARYGITF